MKVEISVLDFAKAMLESEMKAGYYRNYAPYEGNDAWNEFLSDIGRREKFKAAKNMLRTPLWDWSEQMYDLIEFETY